MGESASLLVAPDDNKASCFKSSALLLLISPIFGVLCDMVGGAFTAVFAAETEAGPFWKKEVKLICPLTGALGFTALGGMAAFVYSSTR